MDTEAVLFSETFEDLVFAREHSDKIIRFAEDFSVLRQILESSRTKTVFIHSSLLDEKTRNLAESVKASLYPYSSNLELKVLLQKADLQVSDAAENFAKIPENLAELSPAFASLVGSSPAMQRLRSQIVRVASFDVSVLLLGETGTGKTRIARAIHELSPRRNKLFKDEVLANSNENLIETRLFGVVRGAFTGALDEAGDFELADCGTVFLDEIGDTSMNMQTKLLQVLSEHKICRVGSQKSISVDNRMIFATNVNLDLKIKQGLFREDLYQRMNDITIKVPPLRERLEDIPELCRVILKREKIYKEISDSAIKTLQTFAWKGNVRQLEKCLRRAGLIECKGNLIEPRHIYL